MITVRRLIKFGAVGASGVGVNLALLYLFTDIAGLHYIASTFIAIEASIITNFYLNNRWTFGDRRGTRLLSRLVKFNAVSGVGVGLNIGLMALLVEVVGVYYLLAEFMAILCVFGWNYVLSNRYVWRKGLINEHRRKTETVSIS